jgi:hypothetical protein
MAPTPKRVVISLCSLAVIVVLSGPAAAGVLSDQIRSERAIGFLRTQQRRDGSIPAFSAIGSTADAVLAITSAGVGPRILEEAIGYLRRQAAAGHLTGIGLKAKVVLAVVAAGGDPRRFGPQNLVHLIRTSARPNGRFGTATVFDQALGVLALVAARAPIPSGSTQWLIDGECPDGGWAFDAPYDGANDDAHCVSDPSTDFFSSDSNTTSYVVQALVAANDDAWTGDPFDFFDLTRDADKGGWAFSTAFITTDANSTALVLQAYAAATVAVPAGGRAALRGLQYARCGAWAFGYEGGTKGPADVGATIGAVPGLLLEPLPLSGGGSLGPAPRTPRCPGA